MSLAAYKIVHLVGAFLLFAALGALALRSADAGEAGSGQGRSKLDSITHGVALLVLLVSGFGMLAKAAYLQSWPLPGWMWGKVVLWLLLGAALALPRRAPRLAAVWWWTFPLLGGVAAWLAIYKPF